MKVKEEFETVKDAVMSVLANDERARYNDKWLIMQTLKKLGFQIYIPFKQMKYMPSFETITRCRRYIQNDLLQFKPAIEVMRERDRKESDWRKIFRRV